MFKPAGFFGVLFLVLQVAAPGISASKAPVRGAHAIVVSTEPRASQVGVDILQEGGNAVDAAVAVAFALAVTHPAAGNIGGGGFMMIRVAKTSEIVAVDYRETAPGTASRTMYQDDKGNVIKNMSTVGYRAAGIPGTVAGLALAGATAC
jgi:gamma-glutamyltranspeptidase/glutathione hydrolase